MRLPESLLGAIRGEAENVSRQSLVRASSELTEAYKASNFIVPALQNEAQRCAYLQVRLPATFASNVNVFKELRNSVPELAPRSVLDLGAGPGTSLWALAEVFPTIERITAVERDGALIGMGKRLAEASEHSVLREAKWEQQDLARAMPDGDSDLIVASYALGELPRERGLEVVRASWKKAKQAVVIIEPGTRRGFEFVWAARGELIGAGGRLAAPCPHELQCPMKAAGDWCHFAQRIERTAEHRRLKEGTLGYEDEKFSYVAGSKLPVTRPRARIVRHPMKLSGYVKLQLCSGPEIENQTVTRSNKAAYKDARKAEWGEGWNHSPRS